MTRPTPDLPRFIQDQLPRGVRRTMHDLDGIGMHVMELGEGPPVLMLHGNPTWSFLYRRVAAVLADRGLRLVIPDMVGLGYSDRPRDPSMHTLENHGRWLGALLDRLALRELVFVGQDWGGPIGLHALAARPGLLQGLVLLNTVTGPPRPGFRPTVFHRFARLPLVSDAAFRLLGFPQRMLHLAQGDRASIRGDVRRAYLAPLRGLGRNAAPLHLARMVPDRPGHPSIAPLERCHAFVLDSARDGLPVELVWGMRDPVLGRVVNHLERQLPDARVTRTEAGHFLQEEVPEVIAEAIGRVAGSVGLKEPPTD